MRIGILFILNNLPIDKLTALVADFFFFYFFKLKTFSRCFIKDYEKRF